MMLTLKYLHIVVVQTGDKGRAGVEPYDAALRQTAVFRAILRDTAYDKPHGPLAGHVISQTTSDDIDAVHSVR